MMIVAGFQVIGSYHIILCINIVIIIITLQTVKGTSVLLLNKKP